MHNDELSKAQLQLPYYNLHYCKSPPAEEFFPMTYVSVDDVFSFNFLRIGLLFMLGRWYFFCEQHLEANDGKIQNAGGPQDNEHNKTLLNLKLGVI